MVVASKDCSTSALSIQIHRRIDVLHQIFTCILSDFDIVNFPFLDGDVPHRTLVS